MCNSPLAKKLSARKCFLNENFLIVQAYNPREGQKEQCLAQASTCTLLIAIPLILPQSLNHP